MNTTLMGTRMFKSCKYSLMQLADDASNDEENENEVEEAPCSGTTSTNHKAQNEGDRTSEEAATKGAAGVSSGGKNKNKKKARNKKKKKDKDEEPVATPKKGASKKLDENLEKELRYIEDVSFIFHFHFSLNDITAIHLCGS